MSSAGSYEWRDLTQDNYRNEKDEGCCFRFDSFWRLPTGAPCHNPRVRPSIVLLSLTLLFSARPAAAATGGTLLEAAAAGDAAAVRALLKQGQNVDAPGPDGATPLHWAAHADDLEIVDVLIRAGANVSATNVLGVSPIYIAASNGSPAVIRRLLDAHADVNAADATGDTVLMAAVRAENPETVKLLIERGVRVNEAEPALSHTALMWAVRDEQYRDHAAPSGRRGFGRRRNPCGTEAGRASARRWRWIARRRHRAKRRAAAGRAVAARRAG